MGYYRTSISSIDGMVVAKVLVYPHGLIRGGDYRGELDRGHGILEAAERHTGCTIVIGICINLV